MARCKRVGIEKNIDTEKLKHDLINNKKAVKSLHDLYDWATDKATAPWHSSKKECMENVLGKLLEYGFNNSIDEFARMLPLLKKCIEVAYNCLNHIEEFKTIRGT